ncbi:hypothetical protein [Marinobacter sp.]|uniref:hypothetical protein n=1 Tax=Marinobacter sp. TaxID=50741 RepID=UPI003A90BDC4
MPGQVVKELGEKLPGAGRPMQTVMTRIVDPATGKDCKPGEQLPKNTAGKLLKRKLRDDLG